MVKNVSTLMIVITFREKEAKLKKKKGQKCLHIDDCNHIFFSIEFDHRFHLLLHFSCLLMTCLIFVNVYILRLLLFTRLYFYIFLFYQMVKSWCTLINAFLSSPSYHLPTTGFLEKMLLFYRNSVKPETLKQSNV